ncbi:MAG: hypothetical protein ACKODN_00015 [Actinomycetota bacterium]
MTLQPRLSETISERVDDRFTYFLCQRLFPDAKAASLLAQFPTTEIEALRRPEVSHATLSSMRHPELVEDFLQRTPDWNTVYNWFTSREFVADVLTTFRPQIKAKYPPIIRTILGKWIMKPSRYYGEVQFSLRLTGSVLSPHTDNADKVLALIVYFPDVGETTTGGGTSFYLPKNKRSEFSVFNKYMRVGWLIPLGLRRLQSAKLPTVDSFNASQEVGEHLEFFDRHYRRAFDAPYQLGAAGGFIKNQYSWHDLRLDDVPPGMIRRSLLVNVFLRPSQARALVNRIFARR